MNKERFVLLCTDLLSGKTWAYGSVVAMLAHIENPLDITPRGLQKRVKIKGYPIIVNGCRIDRVQVLSMSNVEQDNPGILTPEDTSLLNIEP